ncbi:MAG: MTH938/NDUFAF3 family protein [Candidatus Nealsonbacteria bacterium]
MIEEYKPGFMVIDGRTYQSDVETRWTGEVLDWPRQEENVLELADIENALSEEPETIVIGTGEYGSIQVSEELKREVLLRGIELIVDKTEQALKTFNVRKEESEEEEGIQEKVIGLFHLS